MTFNYGHVTQKLKTKEAVELDWINKSAIQIEGKHTLLSYIWDKYVKFKIKVLNNFLLRCNGQ